MRSWSPPSWTGWRIVTREPPSHIRRNLTTSPRSRANPNTKDALVPVDRTRNIGIIAHIDAVRF